MEGTMFASSNQIGQSSNSSFGSPSIFEQTNNTNNNQFSQKLLGSTSFLGAQTGGSVFGGTSTGGFCTQPASPAFGASSSPAFGSSMPAFGVSSTPAFGASSSGFGGSSRFGQKPALGSSSFATPFGASSHLAFNATSTPACGSISGGMEFNTTNNTQSRPFSFWSSPAFGQSKSSFDSSQFCTATTPLRTQSSRYGGQVTTAAFGSPGSGQTSFGGQRDGSRVLAMPACKDKSHEELRWEHYQQGDKGSSVFGQKPAFGGFGSTTPSQPSFGSTFGAPSQPAFGTNLFGSTTFRAPSQPAFGTPSTPTFGTTTPAFGATSTPDFGAASAPTFGSTSTPAFGATGSAFGSSPFGASSAAAFGQSSTPSFGQSSTPAFGQSSTPTFGQSSTPAFGATSSPFSFGSRPAFGQSTSAFGSSPFGTATTAFGAQSSPFGGQATTPAFGSPGFGQTSFGGQRGGSRVTPYAQTPEADSGSGTQPAGKLESISAMPAYKDKSHEELRWEDYQQGDKGGPNPAGQTSGGMGFNTNPTQANPFSSTTLSNPFTAKTSTLTTPGFGNSTPTLSSSPFGASTSIPFGSTPSVFGSTPGFGSTTSASPFGAPSTSTFGTSTSLFGTTQAQGATPSFASGLNFGNTQSSPLFQSTTPSLGQASSPFGQTGSAFGQTGSAFGQTTSAFGQTGSAFALTLTISGQATTPTFGSPRYAQTPEADSGSGTQPAGKLESISAMPAYIDKSHEELKWADYQQGDKGGQATTPAFGSPGFGQTSFGGQRGGSRVTPYAQTPEADSGSGTQPAGKLESISAIPAYKDKSHEELRWEDYEQGDKGGPNPAGQTSGGMGFNTNPIQSNPFFSSPAFSHLSANPFSSSMGFNQTSVSSFQ